MLNEWSIQKEIINATQKWPVIILYCLTGCLIGWITSFFLPNPYRATIELYVGLNTQRISNHQTTSEPSEIPILNIDDYKNWQMSSLNSVIFTNDIIDGTLQRLQEQDTYWKDIDRRNLSKNLHAYWRNAGKWRLAAENLDARHAKQAVIVWQEVVLEEINHAIATSHTAYEINRQLQSITDAKTKAVVQAAQYDKLNGDLLNCQEVLSQLPQNQILSDTRRDTLWMLANQALAGTSATVVDLKFPALNSPIHAYLDWIDEFLLYLDAQNENAHQKIGVLEIERKKYATDFAETSRSSLGLSPDLIVEGITENQTDVDIIRPTSQMILIGALLGLILWLIVRLAKMCLRSEI